LPGVPALLVIPAAAALPTTAPAPELPALAEDAPPAPEPPLLELQPTGNATSTEAHASAKNRKLIMRNFSYHPARGS
jgi:hypothetical protein